MEPKKKHPLSERFDREGWPQCDTCEKVIPLERLEAIPNTTTCVKHSREAGYVGVMNYAHKTAGEVAIVKGDNEEALRQLWRGYNRGR